LKHPNSKFISCLYDCLFWAAWAGTILSVFASLLEPCKFSNTLLLSAVTFRAIGEAAYRSTVLNGGKNQKTLTVGWEVLGLDKETAQRIFDEAAKEGFISERETMYGGQTRKYDKKGNQLDDEGKTVDPEAEGDDAEEEGGVTSNVYECGECGYTLFIAKGREFKFFGEDFKCPECGAEKDKFKPSDIEAE